MWMSTVSIWWHSRLTLHEIVRSWIFQNTLNSKIQSNKGFRALRYWINYTRERLTVINIVLPTSSIEKLTRLVVPFRFKVKRTISTSQPFRYQSTQSKRTKTWSIILAFIFFFTLKSKNIQSVSERSSFPPQPTQFIKGMKALTIHFLFSCLSSNKGEREWYKTNL